MSASNCGSFANDSVLEALCRHRKGVWIERHAVLLAQADGRVATEVLAQRFRGLRERGRGGAVADARRAVAV